MSEVLVRVQNARLSLRSEGAECTVLCGLNITVLRGQHTAIVGANGAGKSTLLRLLRGEAWLNPQGGSITWHTCEGEEHSPLAGRAMVALVSAAQQEQYVRQDWELSGEDILLTAFADSPLLYSPPEKAQRQAAKDMAVQLRCHGLLSRPANTLSQGQLRLLLLGRALLRRPALLLLDEYLDGLDQGARKTVLEALQSASRHVTLLLAVHREGDIPAWVQKRVYLRQGTLHEHAETPQAAPLAHQVEVGTMQGCVARQRGEKPPLLALNEATVYINRVAVLHHITWTMRQGEHWRIYGGNGAGKSTLLRLLAGDEYPAAGGSIARHLPRHGGTVTDLESIRRGIRLVSDKEQTLYSYDLTGLELVLSGFDNVVGQYREYTAKEVDEARQWMKAFEAEPWAGRRMRALSTGQLRRLLLARALCGSPEILLLDEPCSGLDSAARCRFLHMLHQATAHVHLILVSHHNEDHLPAINREACMNQGVLTILS